MDSTILDLKLIEIAMDSGDPKAFVQFSEIAAKNAAIISKYPFLLPIMFDGKCQKEYRFSYTKADCVPKGWHQLILDMSEEIMQYLNANNIDPLNFKINQLKEKYGTIRLYYTLKLNDFTTEVYHEETIDKIISKYEAISDHTCCECGKKATLQSTGWICPYCQECAKRLLLIKNTPLDFVPKGEKKNVNYI